MGCWWGSESSLCCVGIYVDHLSLSVHPGIMFESGPAIMFVHLSSATWPVGFINRAVLSKSCHSGDLWPLNNTSCIDLGVKSGGLNKADENNDALQSATEAVCAAEHTKLPIGPCLHSSTHQPAMNDYIKSCRPEVSLCWMIHYLECHLWSAPAWAGWPVRSGKGPSRDGDLQLPAHRPKDSLCWSWNGGGGGGGALRHGGGGGGDGDEVTLAYC